MTLANIVAQRYHHHLHVARNLVDSLDGLETLPHLWSYFMFAGKEPTIFATASETSPIGV